MKATPPSSGNSLPTASQRSFFHTFRTAFAFALIFLAPRFCEALDYYWAGSSGDWSDYATHWRICSTSGPAANQVPTDGDNVFFTGDNYTVNIDQTVVYCHNMDWSGVGTGVFCQGDVNKDINIYGNLVLAPPPVIPLPTGPLDWQFLGTLKFLSVTVVPSASTITTAGQLLKGHVYFESADPASSGNLPNGIYPLSVRMEERQAVKQFVINQ